MNDWLTLGLACLALTALWIIFERSHSIRLFFLRRYHASVIRRVEAEMRACYGYRYMPDPGQSRRLWRDVYWIEFGEYPENTGDE